MFTVTDEVNTAGVKQLVSGTWQKKTVSQLEDKSVEILQSEKKTEKKEIKTSEKCGVSLSYQCT